MPFVTFLNAFATEPIARRRSVDDRKVEHHHRAVRHNRKQANNFQKRANGTCRSSGTAPAGVKVARCTTLFCRAQHWTPAQ
jgi:hypothetical protein